MNDRPIDEETDTDTEREARDLYDRLRWDMDH